MTVPTKAWDFHPDEAGPDGWCGGGGPAIASAAWPRSRVNGMPMVHVLTIRLPEEYRTHGQDLVALSVFQADDHAANRIAGVRQAFADPSSVENDDAFWSGLVSHVRSQHPRQTYREDAIGGGWAWIWLTAAEFDGRCSGPDVAGRPTGYESVDGMNAWDHTEPERLLLMTERQGDPNIGVPMEEFPAWLDALQGDPPVPPYPGYVPMFSEPGEALNLERFFHVPAHLGGTSYAAQGEPPGFSPYYLEWDESMGGNLGGGTAQLDLARNKLSWAC